MTLAVSITSWVWLALEIGLRVRDRRHGTGSAAGDRGTRTLIVCTVVPAMLAAVAVSILLPVGSPLELPGGHQPVWAEVAGMVVMWCGLVVRVTAVATLGRSFRTTVEVDEGQAVVQRGLYGLVRHPSYAGVLLITSGYGLALGNWVSLALGVVVPALALARRIRVEEAALATTLGPPYLEYRARTSRLVPGVW